MFGAWNWSWRLFRIAGVEVSVHWTLLAMAAFTSLSAAANSAWLLLPVLLLIPFVSILLHEFGHVTATRLVGGRADKVVMWMFGGLAMCEVPASPGRQFFVAAAGPLVNLLIMCTCLLAAGQGVAWGETAPWSQGWVVFILTYTASWNFYNLLVNLLPIYPMDGGRMLRAALWPVLGRGRAVITTIYIAYVGLGLIMLWAGLHSNVMIFFISIIGLINVVQEHRAVQQGMDPYTGEDVNGFIPERSWLQRWNHNRQERKAEQLAQELSREQETLDRLLAKVSAGSLSSLTQAERNELHRISKRQKERARG
jgi:stage IV sporulation protein FB